MMEKGWDILEPTNSGLTSKEEEEEEASEEKDGECSDSNNTSNVYSKSNNIIYLW